MTETRNIDSLLAMAKEGIELETTRLDPDDDWMPTLLLVNPQDELIVGALMLETSELQEFAVRQLIVENNGVAAVLSQTVWFVSSEKSRTKTLDVPPSEHPDREEAVTIIGADIEGAMELHRATVERHEGEHPTLGPWEHTSVGGDFVGRFPDCFRESFATVVENLFQDGETV